MDQMLSQPWYVDLAVVLLPITLILLAYELTRPKSCFECGHKAAEKRGHRYFCERCVRAKFGAPVVVFERVTVDLEDRVAMPVPPSAPPRSRGRNGKPNRRKASKKAK